ncbi:hypothetical protein RN92_00605 [Fusobacterium hwasookii ChDC F206]|uniref:HhH-GPD domain-containing protein n=1 Tax=Fusobacterium hwasookii ChDC F206 TaxID=1307443 RepID=A0AAC9A0J3_9FUSO|nr:hypothetical protein RN92_00605 [Fusobacterium hwasookii ChDC F206]
MTKKEKVKKILVELEKKFGTPKCALDFKTPFELLVAVILSAQCTDKRVNIVTEEMFKHVNTPEDFANMELEEIENYINSLTASLNCFSLISPVLNFSLNSSILEPVTL